MISSQSPFTQSPFTQSIEGCLERKIGERGIGENSLALWLERTQKGISTLQEAYRNKTLPILNVPETVEDIEPAQMALEKLSQGASTLVFLGTGGSSLGGQTLAQLGGWYIPGERTNPKGPRVRFCDNLDARSFEKLLSVLDLKQTRFIVTSKSGGTGETLVQAVVTLKAVKDAGLSDAIPDLFLGLTEPYQPGKTNGLRDLCQAHHIPVLDHHTGVGGRYSGLTNVGLLPALAMGLDVKKLRAGAQGVIEALLKAQKGDDLPAAVGAAVIVALSKKRGVKNVIMMPYSDRLERFSAWYVQLWAESLGKQGEGTTPIAALGPVDQHSQLQLYMDGPKNHMVMFLRTQCEGQGPVVDAELARRCGLDYMAGKHMGDLVAAQQKAVPEALMSVGCPVRTIDIKHLDEYALGALMMSFMLETVLAADLLEIDPFDQPGVELGKKIARKYLEE